MTSASCHRGLKFSQMLFNIKRNISKLLSNIKFEKEKEEVYEDVYKGQKLEKEPIPEKEMTGSLNLKAKLAAKHFPEEIKKNKAKDKNCLLSFYPETKIPRNTRCESTGLKYKNCCGKLL